VLPDDAGSKKEGGDSEVGLQQVREGDTQQVTTDTQVEEGKTETDTTSDKTAQTDTEKVNLLSAIKEGQKLPTKPKQTKNENGVITSGKVHLYHSTNGIENLNNILENGIDFEKQKAVGGLFFSKLGSPYRRDDSFVVIETDIENIPFNQRTEGQEVALGQLSDYKIVHSSKMSPRELETLSSLEMILNRETNGGVEGYKKSLQNYKKKNKNSELVKYLESQPTSTEEGMSVKNKIESFANRIVEGEGQSDFSDDALQFYAENQEAIDKVVAQKKKNIPKDKSRERALAIKIARGDKEFSNADIDLYAGSQADVQAEVEAIAKTNSQTVTADTYKAILASTKSTTNQDMAKPEKENAQRKRFWKAWNQSAREKKMDLKQKRKSLNDGIKAYAKKRKGKITAAQLRAVLNKVNNPNLNLDNPVAVKKVEQYVEKVFSDADFANDVDIANKLKTRATKKLNSGRLGGS
jgi:DNA-binding transcriptional regulator YbjK